MYQSQRFINKLGRRFSRIPLVYRVFGVIGFYGILFYFAEPWVAHLGGLFIILAFYILKPDEFLNESREQNKVKNIMILLDVTGDKLRVGLEQVPNKKLKRVAVGEYDEEYAILQFPFNHQVSTDHLFPIQQLDSVHEFFKTNYPQVELIFDPKFE